MPLVGRDYDITEIGAPLALHSSTILDQDKPPSAKIDQRYRDVEKSRNLLKKPALSNTDHHQSSKPTTGLEPVTCGLQNRCQIDLSPSDTNSYKNGHRPRSNIAPLRPKKLDLSGEALDVETIIKLVSTLSPEQRKALIAMLQSLEKQ